MSLSSPLRIGRECFLTALDRTLVVEVLGLSAQTIWVSYPMADTIKEGTVAELTIHDPLGFIGFHTRVSSSPKPNQPSIMLERTETSEQQKARKHWRVSMKLPVSIKAVDETDYHDATLRDLSIEGGLIVTRAQWAAGTTLEMLFQLPHDPPHVILLQAVYCDPTPENGERRYGLHFTELSEDAHEALTAYLYEKLKKLYPKELYDLYPRPAPKR